MRILPEKFYLLLIFFAACKQDFNKEAVVLQESIPEISPRPTYPDHKKRALHVRDSLSSLFHKLSASETPAFLKNTASIFTEVMTNEIFPSWYGTAWDFNGTTEEPGKGAIACGYFVTTTLRDVGLEIQRIRTAQQSAEKIITIINSKEKIVRFSDQPIEVVQKSMKERGNGLYIVGLDFHIGFLLQKGDTTWFIHSNYLNRSGVMKESPWQNSVFYHSRYKVIGKIDDDETVLKNWLRKTK